MGLSKYKLGELIQLRDERNSDNMYTLDSVKGISRNKSGYVRGFTQTIYFSET